MILAGANAVQTVSALFQYGFGHIPAMLNDLGQWMDGRGYKTLADFRGKLSRRRLGLPWAYARAQYARLLMNPKELMERVPTLKPAPVPRAKEAAPNRKHRGANAARRIGIWQT